MTEDFHYSTRYTLDKSVFAETYDETASAREFPAAYLKSFVLGLLGMTVFSTEITPYIAWFLITLAVVDALSVYFHRPWWLARQMLSRASNQTIELELDNNGITSKSPYSHSEMKWKDVLSISQTSCGWLLCHNGGKTYISKRFLTTEANRFIEDMSANTSRKH